MYTHAIAEPCEGPRHIKRRPNCDAIAQVFREDCGVVSEVAGEVAIGPAAAVFERLRQIPVIDGAEGAYLCFQQRVHEAAVMIETFLVDGACADGLNARPRN